MNNESTTSSVAATPNYRQVAVSGFGNFQPQATWVVALTLLLVLGQALPELKFFSTPSSYLPFHTVLEFGSMAVSAMVFALAWNLHRQTDNSHLIILGTGFLAVSLIDIAHTLSYVGMPDLVTPSGPEKAINFWLAGRYVEAGVLLAVAFRPVTHLSLAACRSAAFAAVLLAAGVWWLGIFHTDWLPHTFVPDQGLTTFKIGAEYLLVGIYGTAAIQMFLKYREPHNADLRWLAAAAWIQGLAELFFTLYADVTDLFNLFGHIYKMAAYWMVYRALFVSGVRAPYRQLSESLEMLSDILATTQDGFCRLDVQGRLLDVNPAYCRQSGYTRTELLGMRVTDLEAVENSAQTTERIQRLMQEGSDLFQTRHRRKDESIWDVEVSATYHHHDVGGGQFFVFLRNITHRKNAEEALKESEQRWKFALEGAGDGVWDWNIQTGEAHFSKCWKEMLGYTEGEITGNPSEWISRVHPDDSSAAMAAVQAHLDGKAPSIEDEFRMLCKDGSWKWIQGRGMVVSTSEDGKPVRMVGTNTDITKRRQTEEMLRKLAKAVEQSSASVVITDHMANIEYANPRFTEVTGYSADEVIGKNPRIFRSDQTPREIYQDLWTKLKSGRAWEGEFSNRRKNGEIFWEECHIAPVKSPLGEITHYVAVKNDITDRKRMQSRLEQVLSEQKAILENELVGIATIKDRTILWANPAFEQMLGYASGELNGIPTHQYFLSEEAYLAFGTAAYPTLAAGDIYRSKVEHLRKDGTRIWVDVSGSMLDREIDVSLWVFLDVSALVRSKEQLKEAQRVAQLGSWENDFTRSTVTWSDEMFRIYGLEPQAQGPTYDEWIAIIHPDDRVLVDMLFGHSRINVTHRIACPDGQLKFIRVLGKSEFAEDGTSLRTFGTAQDITLSALQEIEIKTSEERFRLIADYTYDWEYWQGVQNEMQYVSPACERVTGYSPLEFYTKPDLIKNIVHPDDAEIYTGHHEDSSDHAESTITFRIVTKDGQVRWIAHGCRAVFGADGSSLGRRVNNRDITDLKNAEQLAHRLAYFDPLTNLPNRRMLLDRLDHGLAQARRFHRSLAVMFLDLDRFKQINDTHGHDVGDALIKEVGKRLHTCIRSGDTVARSGGDEFIIVLPEIASPSDASLVAEKIIHAFSEPVLVDDLVLEATTSIGIAVYPIDGTDDAQLLMKMADQAMYSVKNSGRNGYQLYVGGDQR